MPHNRFGRVRMVARKSDCYKRTSTDAGAREAGMEGLAIRRRARLSRSIAPSRRHDGSIEGYRRQRRAFALRSPSLLLDVAVAGVRAGRARRH